VRCAAGLDGARHPSFRAFPGLFADNSLPDYDEGAAKLLEQRVLSFLGNIE